MSELFTVEPYGWPLMKDAFFSFVSYAIGEKGFQVEFKKASGHDLNSLIPKNGLEAMIDKATGRTKQILKEFVDWLIVNYWGENEQNNSRN
jgi:hypothetical protein